MNQYREGKVKSTPARGVKQNLKPHAYKQWKGVWVATPGLTSCLLNNELASCSQWQGEALSEP